MIEPLDNTEWMKLERAKERGDNPLEIAREMGKLDEKQIKKIINLLLGCCYIYVCLMAAYL